MKEHIFVVLAAGDTAVYAYILNWLADAVQPPDRQAEVALVFRGGGGTGKGLLGRAWVRIFGQHGRHVSSPEHLTGKFNAYLQQCCFLFADDAAAPQGKKAEGSLKRLIIEDTLFIEPKGVDPFEAEPPERHDGEQPRLGCSASRSPAHRNGRRLQLLTYTGPPIVKPT
jgi:phage/plasmid-associated DNA primase